MKDKATPIGVGLALVAVFGSMIMEGSNPASLLKPGPLILVFLGTIGASVGGVMMSDAKNISKLIKVAMSPVAVLPDDAIALMVRFAENARREGLLALDSAANQADDPFLKMGLQMVVDGIDPQQVRELLEAEIAAMQGRHKAGAKFFQDMGGYAPTMGIIGTVMGLVHVLGNLSSPTTLGPLIADAFVATLWGVLSANILWLPISNKLKRVSEMEVRNKQVMLDGILGIQAGGSPRMIEQKLLAHLSPAEREGVREQTQSQKKKAA